MLSFVSDDNTRAIILGIIQGLTEFLPVSSSGHIEIGKYLMRDPSVDEKSMMMTVVLHFATALSTVLVFRKEIRELIVGLFAGWKSEEFQFCLKIVVSMVPAAVVGILFEDAIETLFSKQLLLVGAMLAVTGVLLLLADRARVTDRSVGFISALLVGIAQAIAILPGISRSGATISTSVLLGIDREKAAKFSFLMVVPLIFGKMAKDVLDHILEEKPMFEANEFLPLVLGFSAAFIAGVLACTWMIRLVKACQLYWFAIYCFVVSALVIAESFFGFFAAAAP